MKGDGRTRLKTGEMRVPCEGGPYRGSYLKVNPDLADVERIQFSAHGGYYELTENDSRRQYTWRRTLNNEESSE